MGLCSLPGARVAVPFTRGKKPDVSLDVPKKRVLDSSNASLYGHGGRDAHESLDGVRRGG